MGSDGQSSLVDSATGEILAEAPGATLFDRLGLPAAVDLDHDLLETRYLALSRALHPDFQAAAAEQTRMRAVRNSALLNEAYGVLKNEARRLEYLLGIRDADALTRNKVLDPEFLMEAMERDEEAQAARASADADALAALARSVEAEATQHLTDAADRLRDKAPDTNAVAVLLHQTRVLQRIARDAS